MQLIKDVMYDERPEDVVVYPTSVMVVKSCTEVEITEHETEETFTKYKCDVEVYEVYEYIAQISSVANAANNTANQALEVAQTTNEYAEIGAIMLGEV